MRRQVNLDLTHSDLTPRNLMISIHYVLEAFHQTHISRSTQCHYQHIKIARVPKLIT